MLAPFATIFPKVVSLLPELMSIPGKLTTVPAQLFPVFRESIQGSPTSVATHLPAVVAMFRPVAPDFPVNPSGLTQAR